MDIILLNELLPIRAVTIRFRIVRSCDLPFFHHSSLKAIFDKLLRDREISNHVWIDAFESGRTIFKTGDKYQLNLFCTVSGYSLFRKLLDSIRRLNGKNSPGCEVNGNIYENLCFSGLLDYFTGKPVKQNKELYTYDLAALTEELKFWQGQEQVALRFTSPARLKMFRTRKGKSSFVRDRGILNAGDTEEYIYQALCKISPALVSKTTSDVINYKKVRDQLFWTDNEHTIKNHRVAPFGGVLGEIFLEKPVSNNFVLQIMILGQYTGIGDKRNYGMGRYHLETGENDFTVPIRMVSQSQLVRSSKITSLELACYNIARKHPYIHKYIDYRLDASGSDLDDILEDKTLLGSINLHELSRKLKKGTYKASILQGVILRKEGKQPRPLAVPPLEDRIAQRAVVEVMGLDIDKLSTINSYGYRRGKSRMLARDQILMLNRQGYDWFFEADIEDFFDLISHNEIENRLNSFFPFDPLVPLIMEWVKAPVQFNGKVINRETGLPQGSSISPMLANLMLEDFDSDLEVEGMRLVRFADDFVILCKSRRQALKAAERAEKSLSELGLEFNLQKTKIGEFSDSFKFLGYTFVSGMAVESTRSKQKLEKLQIENIPTASWLAKLLGKQPKLLDELNNTLDKKHRQGDPSPIVSVSGKHETESILPSSEMGSTLFLTQPPKSLHQKNGMLEIIDVQTKEVVIQLNWNDVGNIVLIGRHRISQYCQLSALKNSIPVHYCSATGKYLGVTVNKKPSQEGAELWLKQMQTYRNNSRQILKLAKALVEARIHNQIEVLRQRIRHDNMQQNRPVTEMKKLIKSLEEAENQDQLRGYEGQSSAIYFAQIGKWIPEEYEFRNRKKRPSPDPFNALLSLGYTVLYSHANSVLSVAGLYPWQGFYHQGYGRHFALASDLMEVFRHVIERTAMTMLRSRQLKPNDFYTLHDGSCRLTSDALRIYLNQVSSRMLKPITDKNYLNPMNLHEHLLRLSNQLIRNIRSNDVDVRFFMLK